MTEATMTPTHDVSSLESIAHRIRTLIVDTAHAAGAGHTGGSLSEVEILTALYFSFLKVDPSRPDWEERDRFILSKGHASLGYYVTLALRGYFPLDSLKTFDREDSALQAHPDMHKCKGVDYSTGSLGQGLSIGLGMALGRLKKNLQFMTVVLLGDGECQEGQVWEAAMFAGSKRIPKLIAIVDYNKVQLSNTIDANLSLEPFSIKWEAFGWNVLSVDGHNIADLLSALSRARAMAERGPVVIIANTIKGKGVSFMEGNYEWHGKAPNDQEYAAAKKELSDR